MGVEQALASDSRSLIFLQVSLLDENGYLNTADRKKVRISVEGPGELLGFGTAEPSSLENDPLETVKESYEGRLLAVIKNRKENGIIRVTFSAEGMENCITEMHNKESVS